MFKILGRIVARGKTAGLFIPMNNDELDGIYEVRECLGELTIRKVGEPAMPRERFTGLDLGGLFAERPVCCMTHDELQDELDSTDTQ